MKRAYLFAVFILLSASALFGQDSAKTNPIIYADLAFSSLTTVTDGLLFSGGFNYQAGNDLFTLRTTGIGHMDVTYAGPGPFVNRIYGEIALLYGRRWISHGHSFSLSAGLAMEGQTVNTTYRELPSTQTHTNYPGLPVQAGVLWFRPRKRRSRIYDIIPYGKPTGFGSSIGLNIAGNVSAHSFISFGVVFGEGWLRRY